MVKIDYPNRCVWKDIKQRTHTYFCDLKNQILDVCAIKRYNGGDMTELFIEHQKKNKLKHILYEALQDDNKFITYFVNSYVPEYMEEGQRASYAYLGIGNWN